MTDYRSDRMESPEGRGIARRAWDEYVRVANKVAGPAVTPLVTPVARYLAANMTADLFGFWLMWHLEGGFEGLQRVGMSRSAIYRRVRRFRQMTGKHPDEYVLPGVSFDLAAYHGAAAGDASPVL